MSPPWVIRNLFRGIDAIEVVFHFLPRQELTYRAPSVEFQVLAGQVRTLPRHASREAREAATDAARRVLDVLKETPVVAVGFNFGYDAEASELDEILSSSDRGRFEENNWPLQEIAVARKIAYEDAGTLSIVLLRPGEGGTGRIDLNFHWDVLDAATADHRIRSHAEDAHRFGLLVLEQVYNLRLEQ